MIIKRYKKLYRKMNIYGRKKCCDAMALSKALAATAAMASSSFVVSQLL